MDGLLTTLASKNLCTCLVVARHRPQFVAPIAQIPLGAFHQATSAQGLCYLTGRCAYLPSVTCYRQSIKPPPPIINFPLPPLPPPPPSTRRTILLDFSQHSTSLSVCHRLIPPEGGGNTSCRLVVSIQIAATGQHHGDCLLGTHQLCE